MQDKYAGDVGDFGKYGLLRWICGITGDSDKKFSLGVLWYWVPPTIDLPLLQCNPKRKPNDGKHTGYLHSSNPLHNSLKICDENLFVQLKKLVGQGNRTTQSIQEIQIWPHSTTFNMANVSYDLSKTDSNILPLGKRELHRTQWFKKAQSDVHKKDFVFLDPDNGIQGKSISVRARKAGKYVFLNEIKELFLTGKHSLIIYHHLGRNKTHYKQISSIIKVLHELLGKKIPAIFPLRYVRGTSRAFFVLPRNEHCNTISTQLRSFLESSWCLGRHFDRDLLLHYLGK